MFRNALNDYLIARSLVRLNARCSSSLFKEDCYQVKKAAVNKMLSALNGEQIEFNDADLHALCYSHLGKIIEQHRDEWPECFSKRFVQQVKLVAK